MGKRIFLNLLVFLGIGAAPVQAAELTDSLMNMAGTPDTIKLFVLLTLLSLIPAFLILTTSFTRILVVLSFLRSSLGTQQNPPNQVVVGLAFFLSLFIMQPVYTIVYEDAIQPLVADEITIQTALERGEVPVKGFLLEQTREKDLQLFLDLAQAGTPEGPDDIPMTVAIPAFAISELRTAFTMGFLIFIPFLIIDMVVASILMSMGMFMLSPVMISLPFKLLLFVLVDGWYLVVESLVRSFQ